MSTQEKLWHRIKYWHVLVLFFITAAIKSCSSPEPETAMPEEPSQPTETEQAILEEPCSAPEQAIQLYEKYKDIMNTTEIAYLNSLGDVYSRCLGEYDEALVWYEKGAELGSAQAAYHLATIYLHEKEDVAQAHRWYQNSAELGSIAGAVYLGDSHFTLKEYKQAEKWYLMALSNEVVTGDFREVNTMRYRASYHLGELNYYEFNDYEKAYYYYHKALSFSDRADNVPTKRATQAFYGQLNARVMGKFMEKNDVRFSFDEQMVYIQPANNKGAAFANKADLFSLARNLQQNGYDIRAMGIYYSTIAFGLVTLEEVNAELKATGLNITRAQKEQAKEWQNKVFAGIYSFKPHVYTGELE